MENFDWYDFNDVSKIAMMSKPTIRCAVDMFYFLVEI